MKQSFYSGNRKALLEKFEGDFVFFAFSGMPKIRSADDEYPFSASRDFVYLTGLEQKNLVYVLLRENGEAKEILYVPETDAMTERWRGRMIKFPEAAEISGIPEEKIRERKQFEEDLPALLKNGEAKLHLDFSLEEDEYDVEYSRYMGKRLQEKFPGLAVENCHSSLQSLRIIKQPEELEVLDQSIRLTQKGIEEMLKVCRPGLYEYNLRAAFEKVLADAGRRVTSFETIIGAGKNSLCLHYHEADCELKDGDMILLDLGALCGFSGADISRVFPANGKFTARQAGLCSAAADAVDKIVEVLKPGVPLKYTNVLTDEFILPYLQENGLCQTIEEVTNYRWHNTSHHLGFDVHDDCDRNELLAPGMVITMEVGIYVPEWGEGVRIEDDVLITENGSRNLSDFIPRRPEEIEAVMAH